MTAFTIVLTPYRPSVWANAFNEHNDSQSAFVNFNFTKTKRVFKIESLAILLTVDHFQNRYVTIFFFYIIYSEPNGI